MRIMDHPRMCGEKQTSIACRSSNRGSPPHVRGKVLRGERKPEKIRITPACAGKSLYFLATSAAIKDHPRMCGEKSDSSCLYKPP